MSAHMEGWMDSMDTRTEESHVKFLHSKHFSLIVFVPVIRD